MSIASEISRINSNIAAAYGAIENAGLPVPTSKDSEHLADSISKALFQAKLCLGLGVSNDYSRLDEDERPHLEVLDKLYQYLSTNEINYNFLIKDYEAAVLDSEPPTGFIVIGSNDEQTQIIRPLLLSNDELYDFAYYSPESADLPKPSIEICTEGDDASGFNGFVKRIESYDDYHTIVLLSPDGYDEWIIDTGDIDLYQTFLDLAPGEISPKFEVSHSENVFHLDYFILGKF